MGDRFTTVIEMGGPITYPQLKEIAEHAASCGLSVDYESVYEVHYILSKFKYQMTMNKYLEVCDNDLAPDMRDELTDYLQQQGIPYNVRVDAKYEYDAEFFWWRKGMAREKNWPWLNHDATEVLASIGMLEAERRNKKSLKDVIKKLKQIPPKMDEAILIGDDPDSPAPTGSVPKPVDTTGGGG